VIGRPKSAHFADYQRHSLTNYRIGQADCLCRTKIPCWQYYMHIFHGWKKPGKRPFYAGDTHPTFVAQHLSDFPCHTSDFCRSTFTPQQLCSPWKPCGRRKTGWSKSNVNLSLSSNQSHLIVMALWLYKLSLVITLNFVLYRHIINDTYAGLPSAGIVACAI